MAKKTVLICDKCGSEVNGDGAALRVVFTDARKGARSADLCKSCAEEMPGHATGRRGRKPKEAVAA